MPSQVPILTYTITEMTEREDLLIDQIDALIRRFLTRPNHQSPYAFIFHWLPDDRFALNYSVTLAIREPARQP